MSSATRPPAPPAPPPAREVFGSRLPLAEAYAHLLAGDGVLRGLIGPREVPRLWERHLLNCAVVGEAIPRGATVCDLGSGAGLPGMALALARPDLEVTLVEPLLRRTAFLDQAVTDLGLDSCTVVRARAEELAGGRRFAVVTSRAVAPMARLARWSMPLVAPAGVMLAMKGARAVEELRAATTILRTLGGAEPEVLRLGEGVIDPPTTVVRVARAGAGEVG